MGWELVLELRKFIQKDLHESSSSARARWRFDYSWDSEGFRLNVCVSGSECVELMRHSSSCLSMPNQSSNVYQQTLAGGSVHSPSPAFPLLIWFSSPWECKQNPHQHSMCHVTPAQNFIIVLSATITEFPQLTGSLSACEISWMETLKLLAAIDSFSSFEIRKNFPAFAPRLESFLWEEPAKR